MPVSLDATIGKLHAFELSNFDNSGSLINKVESTFSSFHIGESDDYNDRMNKYSKGNHGGASERFCKNMEEVHKLYEEIKKQEEFEAPLARRLPRGKGKYKGKLPLKCFNCDRIGNMASNYPDKESSEKREYRDDRIEMTDRKTTNTEDIETSEGKIERHA